MAVIVHSCVMLFVVTLCVAASMKNAEECPADMKKRGEICCKPVTCEINEDYQLCNDTHREDKCIRCPPNTTNQDSINTSHLDVQILGICQKIDCNPETRCPPGARITNPDECSETGIAICECDLYKGFCDKDPGTCQIWGGNVTDLTEGVGLTQRFGIKLRTDFVWQKNASLDILKTTMAMDHALNTETAPKGK